jgi:hypothetical protein
MKFYVYTQNAKIYQVVSTSADNGLSLAETVGILTFSQNDNVNFNKIVKKLKNLKGIWNISYDEKRMIIID